MARYFKYHILIFKDYLTGHMNEKHFDVLIDTYLSNKIGIDQSFLKSSLTKGLQAHMTELRESHQMVPAGIGNSFQKDVNSEIRSDHIYWLDKSHDNIFEKEFLNIIENFIDRLNYTCYTGINAYEFHYAYYDTGSHYKRHRDQFKTNGHREFSLINYLNEDWQEANGGALTIYPDNIAGDILPKSQTAVFFKSNELEHEVKIANRPRMSVTGWLKRN